MNDTKEAHVGYLFSMPRGGSRLACRACGDKAGAHKSMVKILMSQIRAYYHQCKFCGTYLHAPPQPEPTRIRIKSKWVATTDE